MRQAVPGGGGRHLGLGSAAVGTSALIVGDQNFKELNAQVDIDLG